MTNNKKLGSDFEAKFGATLAANGFWVRLLAPSASGQPADLIAVKNNVAHLIDCKVCSTGKFALSRVEENQSLSMAAWNSAGNDYAWFALDLGGSVYLLSFDYISSKIRENRASLRYSDIIENGYTLTDFVEECDGACL